MSRLDGQIRASSEPCRCLNQLVLTFDCGTQHQNQEFSDRFETSICVGQGRKGKIEETQEEKNCGQKTVFLVPSTATCPQPGAEQTRMLTTARIANNGIYNGQLHDDDGGQNVLRREIGKCQATEVMEKAGFGVKSIKARECVSIGKSCNGQIMDYLVEIGQRFQ